jgi:hypothetical protein
MSGAQQHASTCRWARPTLDESNPIWLLAEAAPWTCERVAPPRPLEDTAVCARCPDWQPMDRTGAVEAGVQSAKMGR